MKIPAAAAMRERSAIARDLVQCLGQAFDLCEEDLTNKVSRRQR
jgi:hypothetical protein